jgi:hypothetical protein
MDNAIAVLCSTPGKLPACHSSSDKLTSADPLEGVPPVEPLACQEKAEDIFYRR